MRGSSIASVRIGDVDVKTIHLAVEGDICIVELKKKIKKLEDEGQMLEDRLAVLKSREEFLNSVKLTVP